MAKQQLTSLAAKLILDTRQFEDGTTASRKELNTIRKAMQDTETPLEKYERKMADLGDVLKKDSRFQETYNRKAEQFAAELKRAERAADGFHDEMAEGTKTNQKWALSATEMNQGLELATKAVDFLGLAIEKISNLDNEIYELEKYGIAAENFGTFKVLAGGARLETEALADATKNLTIRLGEAVKEPESGIAGVFETLGINAEKLSKSNAIDQLREFSKAVQAVPDYTTKLQIVDELLSDSGTQILDSILLKSGAIEQAAKRAQDLGLGISDKDRDNIEKAAAASKEMFLAWEGFTTQVMIYLAPVLEKITRSAALILGNKDRADGLPPEEKLQANSPGTSIFQIKPAITTDRDIRFKAELNRTLPNLVDGTILTNDLLDQINQKLDQQNQQPAVNIGQ